MVSPTREKRAWPPRDREDQAESAAFEQRVAVVKETVVRSGEVLSSAKEDLSDHQRWLEAQAAAVKADRARHDRWLQRQRERQEALERREQAKLRRRQMRQRVAQAVKSTVSAVASAISSAFWLVVGKAVAGLDFIDALEAGSVRWVGTRVRQGALYIARIFSVGGSWVGRKTGAILRMSWNTLSAGSAFAAATTTAFAGSSGKALAAGSSVAAAKTAALARSTGEAISAGISRASAKIHELTPSVARVLSLCFSGLLARAHDLWRATVRVVGPASAAMATKVDELARSTGSVLAPAFARIRAKAHEMAPALAERVDKVGIAARNFAGAGTAKAVASLAFARAWQAERPAARVEGAVIPVSEGPLTGDDAGAAQAQGAPAPLAAAEKAVSLSRHIGGFEHSQMLIVAGAVLLVLGGLLLGGGLILRAGSPSQVGAASSETVTWFFEQKDLPLADRSIFIFTGTPNGVRIKGLSINAENRSDQPLTAVGGVIKPDVEGSDLPLEVTIDMPKGEASIAPAPEAANALEGAATTVVPAHSLFKLVFPFPEEAGEQDGVTPEEVVQTFGGLMLKVRYDAAGKEKSFMRYLSPAMLKDQLAEIEALAKGS
jgi:hypothetical protein